MSMCRVSMCRVGMCRANTTQNRLNVLAICKVVEHGFFLCKDLGDPATESE